jgi:hypothetical protein
MVIKGKKVIAPSRSMSTDEKVSQNTAGVGLALLSSTPSIGLEGLPSSAPNQLFQMPLNDDSRVFAERIQERFAPARSRHQLREHGRGNNQAAASQRAVQARLSCRAQSLVPVPQSDNYIGINRCCHRPRISRIQQVIPFLPDRIPGFPMPRYFANGLSVRTGRT